MLKFTVVWTIIWLLITNSPVQLFLNQTHISNIKCYQANGPFLPEITAQDIAPNSIFFFETSCKSNSAKTIVIGARQACSVESAARLNPSRQIYLLYTSPGLIANSNETESDRFLSILSSFPNVRIHHLNYKEYTRGTPVEALYANGTLAGSRYAMWHASDVLRYLTLWKYGGIYLDLDLLLVKELNATFTNFVAFESDTFIGSSVLSFDRSPFGKEMARDCIEELVANFNGWKWGSNGPKVITEVMRRRCKGFGERKVDCNGVKVFKSEIFSPVPYRKYKLYVNKGSIDGFVREWTVGLHFWNQKSKRFRIDKWQEGVPYLDYARKFCPEVVEKCLKYF